MVHESEHNPRAVIDGLERENRLLRQRLVRLETGVSGVERMEMLDALYMVDFVTSFPEPTADALIRHLRPDVYVKGTDWTPETVPERESAAAVGARIAICGDSKTHASSALAARLTGTSRTDRR